MILTPGTAWILNLTQVDISYFYLILGVDERNCTILFFCVNNTKKANAQICKLQITMILSLISYYIELNEINVLY